MTKKKLFSRCYFLYSVGFCVFSRYVERVSETLRQKLKQADILVLKRATMADNRQKALEEQAKLEPRIDLLAKTTRELQKLVNYLSLLMSDSLAITLSDNNTKYFHLNIMNDIFFLG